MDVVTNSPSDIDVAQGILNLYAHHDAASLDRLVSVDVNRPMPADFKRQLDACSADARLHWILVEYYRINHNDVATSLAILQHARAQGHHKNPLYLDLLQKLAHKADTDGNHRHLRSILGQLLGQAPASPAFVPQLAGFCDGLAEDARSMMWAISRGDACAIMQRGAIVNQSCPAALIRSRMWYNHACHRAEYTGLQQLFAQLRNAQFVPIYDGMSYRDLEEELRCRGIMIGRRGPATNSVAFKDKLLASDDAYWRHALFDNYGVLSAECDQAVGLFNVMPAQQAALRSAVEKLMSTPDAKQRGKMLYELQRNFHARLDDDTKRQFWVMVDLSDAMKHKALWNLTSERLFKPISQYTLPQLKTFVRELNLKTQRHARRADYWQNWQKLAKSAKEAEESSATGFQKRSDWIPILKNKYRLMSLERLEAEFDGRGLSWHSLERDDAGRLVTHPVISGAPGGRALQLRARLHRSDGQIDMHCPDSGYSSLPTMHLRTLLSEMGLCQGDQAQGTMVRNLDIFRRQQMETYFEESLAPDTDDGAEAAPLRRAKRSKVQR